MCEYVIGRMCGCICREHVHPFAYPRHHITHYIFMHPHAVTRIYICCIAYTQIKSYAAGTAKVIAMAQSGLELMTANIHENERWFSLYFTSLDLLKVEKDWTAKKNKARKKKKKKQKSKDKEDEKKDRFRLFRKQIVKKYPLAITYGLYPYTQELAKRLETIKTQLTTAWIRPTVKRGKKRLREERNTVRH